MHPFRHTRLSRSAQLDLGLFFVLVYDPLALLYCRTLSGPSSSCGGVGCVRVRREGIRECEGGGGGERESVVSGIGLVGVKRERIDEVMSGRRGWMSYGELCLNRCRTGR